MARDSPGGFRRARPAPGACLPGDYVVTVEPAAFRRLLAAWRRLSRLLLPWTRDREGTAFGIPFIDYRRGDGLSVGPGEERGWSPVLIDDTTPWLRDYRGLWGLETGDPFGGERAPAGPRYERTGSVRRCWSDPWDGRAWTRFRRRPRRSSGPSRRGWRRWTTRSPPPGKSSPPGRRAAKRPGRAPALRDPGLPADPTRFAGLEASVGSSGSTTGCSAKSARCWPGRPGSALRPRTARASAPPGPA